MRDVGPGFGDGSGTAVPPDQRINSAPLDRFTVVHLLVGAGLEALGVPLIGALVLSAWFEIVENIAQPSFPSIFPNTAPNDSLANSVLDTAAVAAGWSAAALLGR